MFNFFKKRTAAFDAADATAYKPFGGTARLQGAFRDVLDNPSNSQELTKMLTKQWPMVTGVTSRTTDGTKAFIFTVNTVGVKNSLQAAREIDKAVGLLAPGTFVVFRSFSFDTATGEEVLVDLTMVDEDLASVDVADVVISDAPVQPLFAGQLEKAWPFLV